MTAVITAVVGDHVLQVSDRRISAVYQNGRLRPCDDWSNKTVVYCTPTSVVVMTFTGLAFIHQRGVDEIIASVLCGQPISVNGFFRTVPGPKHASLWHGIDAVRAELEHLFGGIADLERRGGFTMDIAGFKRRPDRTWKPVMWRMRLANGKVSVATLAAFDRPVHSKYEVSFLAGADTPEHRAAVAAELALDPDGVDVVLRRAIDRISANNPSVGGQPFVVWIAPESVIRTGAFVDGPDERFAFAFPSDDPFIVSPWIVTSKYVSPPHLEKIGDGKVSDFLRKYDDSDIDPRVREAALALLDEAVVLHTPFDRYRPT